MTKYHEVYGEYAIQYYKAQGFASPVDFCEYYIALNEKYNVPQQITNWKGAYRYVRDMALAESADSMK